jgi:hypothetical protein
VPYTRTSRAVCAERGKISNISSFACSTMLRPRFSAFHSAFSIPRTGGDCPVRKKI